MQSVCLTELGNCSINFCTTPLNRESNRPAIEGKQSCTRSRKKYTIVSSQHGRPKFQTTHRLATRKREEFLISLQT